MVCMRLPADCRGHPVVPVACQMAERRTALYPYTVTFPLEGQVCEVGCRSLHEVDQLRAALERLKVRVYTSVN